MFFGHSNSYLVVFHCGFSSHSCWLCHIACWILVPRPGNKAESTDTQTYRCKSGTIRKAEHQRVDTFKLRCWRRLMRVPWTARRSNQSIPKEINLEYSLKDWGWSSNILATCCKELTIGKNPDAGKDWRQKEKGMTEDELVGWHHWVNGHELSKVPGDGEGHAGVHGVTNSWTWLSN